jgi:hypothetical protein
MSSDDEYKSYSEDEYVPSSETEDDDSSEDEDNGFLLTETEPEQEPEQQSTSEDPVQGKKRTDVTTIVKTSKQEVLDYMTKNSSAQYKKCSII